MQISTSDRTPRHFLDGTSEDSRRPACWRYSDGLDPVRLKLHQAWPSFDAILLQLPPPRLLGHHIHPWLEGHALIGRRLIVDVALPPLLIDALFHSMVGVLAGHALSPQLGQSRVTRLISWLAPSLVKQIGSTCPHHNRLCRMSLDHPEVAVEMVVDPDAADSARDTAYIQYPDWVMANMDPRGVPMHQADTLRLYGGIVTDDGSQMTYPVPFLTPKVVHRSGRLPRT